MRPDTLKPLLESVRAGELSVEAAIEALGRLPFADLDVARVDHHRAIRCGFPEVIFCPGKRPEDIVRIAREIVECGHDLLATRADAEAAGALVSAIPGAVLEERARAVVRRARPETPQVGRVAIVCAGTSDIPVAEEARVTASLFGARVDTLYDVGVAGLHRLLAHMDGLRAARAIVVVAGMEGALPSVVGGLVARPVIAVPTSVGYGASFGGVAALLGMLNSCAAGVSVVNIDNGFGAGYVAGLINRAGEGDGAAAETT